MRPGDAFSFLITEEIRKVLPPHASYVYLDAQEQIPADTLATLDPHQATVFVYTTYPLVALPSLRQLGTAHPGTHAWQVWANHTWTEVQTLISRPDILGKLPNIFTLTPWDRACPNADYLRFTETIERTSGIKPDHDSAYDYDVARMILRCYEAAHSDDALEAQMTACLGRRFEFEGVTGYYKFIGKAHPVRRHFVYQITQQGLIATSECHR